jgi:CheY-like chemotaxis protein
MGLSIMDPDKSNIVIIDDNPNDIDIVREILENQAQELNIVSFLDPEAAVVFLQNEYRIDNKKNCIVLMDLNMPQKNGFELLSLLKSNDQTSHIQILIYSSSKRKEDIMRAYSLGASSYIIKPLEIEDIQRVLKDVVDYWTKISIL